MRPVTWQQALVTVACFVAIIASHYLGSKDQAAVIALAVAAFNWLREPPKPPSGGSSVQVAVIAFIVGTFLCSTAFALVHPLH